MSLRTQRESGYETHNGNTPLHTNYTVNLPEKQENNICGPHGEFYLRFGDLFCIVRVSVKA